MTTRSSIDHYYAPILVRRGWWCCHLVSQLNIYKNRLISSIRPVSGTKIPDDHIVKVKLIGSFACDGRRNRTYTTALYVCSCFGKWIYLGKIYMLFLRHSTLFEKRIEIYCWKLIPDCLEIKVWKNLFQNFSKKNIYQKKPFFMFCGWHFGYRQNVDLTSTSK